MFERIIFSKRHYKALAVLVRAHYDYSLVEEMGRAFATDNPRFDLYKWELACGVYEPPQRKWTGWIRWWEIPTIRSSRR